MIYYSSSNTTILNLIDNFCNKINTKKIHILKARRFQKSESDIFFVPIYGEEELSYKWENFLNDYANDINNLGKNLFFYLYGVYDLEINKSSTIIKQINNILKFLSVQINIFPLKIIPELVSVESLVYYYKHTFKKNIYDPLIDKLVFFSKEQLLENGFKTINFTSKSDEYSSVIDKLKIKQNKQFLINLLSSITHENVILNRVKTINMNEVLKKTKNANILKFQLKSNSLKDITSLKGFTSLEYLNLTANSLEIINIDELPKKIISLNVGKNKIKQIKIKNKNLKIKKLIIFNNKITNMDFLKKFPNLEYLNIGFNPIKEFPKEIFKLKKLKHLNLSYLPIDFLPKNIIELEQLETIDITKTKIINFNDIVLKLQKQGVKVIS